MRRLLACVPNVFYFRISTLSTSSNIDLNNITNNPFQGHAFCLKYKHNVFVCDCLVCCLCTPIKGPQPATTEVCTDIDFKQLNASGQEPGVLALIYKHLNATHSQGSG